MAFINKPKKATTRIPTIKTSEYQTIYQSNKWKRLKHAKRLNNPLCEVCLEAGITEPAREIHHRIPFKYGFNEREVAILAYNYENLQSLCIKCHHKAHETMKEPSRVQIETLLRFNEHSIERD